MIGQRAAVAAVPAMQEFHPKARHIHLHRTGPRTGAARQAPVDRRFHLGLKRRFGAPFGAALPQPLAHEARAAFRRMPPVQGDFVGRAHHLGGVLRKAGAIAVAGQRGGILRADRGRDLPILLTPQRHPVDAQQWRGIGCRHGRGDLARVHLVAGIKGGLDRLQAGIERPEHLGHIFRAHALAMLAPKEPAMLPREGLHLFGNAADQRLFGRIGQIKRGADVQHPGIHMAKHAIIQALGIQNGAKSGDKGLQRGGRHRAILDKGQGAAGGAAAPQEAHGLLAHLPDAGDGGAIGAGLSPPSRHRCGKDRLQPGDPRLQFCRIIGGDLHHIHALRGGIGETGRHPRPDRIGAREVEHPAVDGFNRGGPEWCQHLSVAQRRLEIVVKEQDHRGEARDRQQVQPRLGDQTQRPLGAADHRARIDAPVGAADMRQIIASEAAVHLRETLGDQCGLIGGDPCQKPQDLARAAGMLGQRFGVLRPGLQHLAPRHDQRQVQHMVRGLAIGTRPLATGIGRDHAADGGA